MSSLVFATDHRRGTLLAAIGVTVLSFDALLVRLAAAPATDVIFWRGLFMAVSLAFVLRVARGRWIGHSLIAGGRSAWILCLSMGLMQVLFVTALLNTAVANVVVILTAAPLFAAVISGLFLGEWVGLRTWVAMAVCLAGIALVFGGSIGTGQWLGDLLAITAALGVAINFTLLRRAPGISRLAVLGGGGAVACLLVAAFAAPLQLGAMSLFWLALMGLVQMPLALLMMTTATRYLPSAEVALFFVIEAVLGTYWVWLILGEEPPGATLFGGALILGTLVVHSWIALRKERRRGAP